ncbi:ABC transporter ATP-binding protein [Sulfurimonas sp. SAG-AH-194-I05]|nr:ABC transporter ATP-binding protein [Sulfurimonas sp. SAG-AH-194-I05]MDF1875746.1 ABC transporter ATP-binding protein [Sulfurimonas sp. SAG-AH-194-I05]
MIQKLRSLLTKRDKQFLFGLFLFSIVISLIETIGISIIMPFMAVATDFNIIHNNEYYIQIYTFFDFNSDVDFVVAFGIILIFFYIFRSIINLFYFYMLNKFTQNRYYLLAYRLFESYMGLPYQEFIARNSSTMTKSIITEAATLTGLISSILFMMSEVFIVIFIYAMMLYVNYKITFLLTIVLALNALLMIKTISKKIKKAGVIREKLQRRFYEIINRSFGNFKLIKLQSNDKDILKDFGEVSYTYAQSNITSSTLQQIPRLFLEAIGFSIVIFIVTYLVWKYDGDVSHVLSTITMFVLALYRLMPSANRIMTSYNRILFSHRSLDIIHHDLMYDIENFGDEKISFKQEIIIKNLNFEYEDDKAVLININLIIKKGSSIAFTGESGSGKSTLVDLIIGLYKPKIGYIIADKNKIDDSNIKSWRSKVGYIPQSVYLFDGTVGKNIAFGCEYNKFKIDDCLKKAKMYKFLNTKEGQDTLVGEGGVMLSGGQKQRIAIARALYLDPEILVLDEATSALDDDTEKEIMDEIYEISADKTLIIIAHRLSTLDRCDRIYRLEDGNIITIL